MRWSLLVMLACWALGVPVHAGPDEPAHVVRAAALARGDLGGEQVAESPTYVTFDVPGWAGRPDPVCYAFDPTAPASCLLDAADAAEEQALQVRRSEYPLWASLPAAIGTIGPAEWARSIGPRLAGVVLGAALVGAALATARRTGVAAAAGVMVAITPMVVFSVAVVNPSGLAIAGSIALWTALSSRAPAAGAPDVRWLLVLGYAAAVLPRRDGLLWTSLIVAIAVMWRGDELLRLWRSLRRSQQGIAVAATVAALVAASMATGSNVGMAAAPLLVPFAVLLRRLWWSGGAQRVASIATVAVATALAFLAATVVRPSGYNTTLWRLIVGATADNLEEAIGVLGWLDTTMPALVVWGWCALLGLLLAGAVASSSPRVAGAAAILAASVLVPWIVEMSLEQYRGTYWQGRYTLPLLVGLPIWLSSRSDDVRGRAVWWTAIGGVAVLLNVSLLAALRRWGVGTDGTLVPWRWDTYDAPVALWALMLIHLVASIGLVVAVLRCQRSEESAEE